MSNDIMQENQDSGNPIFTDSQGNAVMDENVFHELQKEFDMDPMDPLDLIGVMENKAQVQQFLRDTVSVEEMYTQQFLVDTPILAKDEFAGNYNFELILDTQNTGKHWVYSPKLGKIFINMEQVLPLQFRWDPPQDGLWLRTTMVFSLDQYRSQMVHRCHNHMAPDNRINQNIDLKQMKHVVRCMHPASIYEDSSGHLSVLTPLGTPAPGSYSVPVHYQFYCKNSCTSGMNRRPTELIFQLETEHNAVLGRRRILVRVCSCPKRDKEKEEGESGNVQHTPGPGKKRKIAPPPVGKKLMHNNADDKKVYNINIDVVGRENCLAVLKYAHDVMAGQSVRTGQHDFYKPYMEAAIHKMNHA